MIKRGWFLLLTVLLLSVGICLSAHAEEEQDKAITYVPGIKLLKAEIW